VTDTATNPSDAITDPAEIRFALDLVKLLQSDLSRADFLRSVLPDLLATIDATTGGLVSQRLGTWDVEAWIGRQPTLPEALIGEAIDQCAVRDADGWCVAPCGVRSASGDATLPQPTAAALVFQVSSAAQQGAAQLRGRVAAIRQAAHLLAEALHAVETRDRYIRRIEQLSAVLKAAAEGQRLDDDEALLRRIADTATELLRCERASIFLWDRRRKKLIGRPALGIEGDLLEVDDDAGVVGEVLRTAEPKIWNGDSDDQRRVNRSVDRSLDFQTRSLVAVPMGGRRDELIGVFEAINHVEDRFDAFDAAILADLALHAAVAIESQRKRRTLTESRDRLVNDAASATQLIGNHSAVETVRHRAAKVAATDLSVLVLGENGTGKEVLARYVHYESTRRSGPFIAVNCAALVETLLESELFGHEKGAFTDASQTRVGKFELAGGGTLFLDEVGDMSPGGQAKLLRVLEERVVVRVGGSQTIPVDVRVIAATNQPLEELIAAKRFREDLYFRLNVVPLTLPPLRQRGDDVLLLASHFLKHFCYEIGRPIPTFSEKANQALLAHSWPGNIRELRNTIERVCYLCTEDRISAGDLMLVASPANRIAAGSSGISLSDGSLTDGTRRFQVEHIDAAIAACGGNMTDAAARLGLHRSNLYRKMRQLGMQTSGE
jgi:transcriptional regulator with GAF, ATPase, and Fis domain